MRLRVMLQGFAEAHREVFWRELVRRDLHPFPLAEAWEVRLSESKLRELAEQFPNFDILSTRGMAAKPIVVIELDGDAFPGDTKHECGRAVHARLQNLMEVGGYMPGLAGETLFAGVHLNSHLMHKARRHAWISDALFWATDPLEEYLVESWFQRPLKEAA